MHHRLIVKYLSFISSLSGLPWQFIYILSEIWTQTPVSTAMAQMKLRAHAVLLRSLWPGQEGHLAGRQRYNWSTMSLVLPQADWGSDLTLPLSYLSLLCSPNWQWKRERGRQVGLVFFQETPQSGILDHMVLWGQRATYPIELGRQLWGCMCVLIVGVESAFLCVDQYTSLLHRGTAAGAKWC